jgi:hypothetical protein
VTAARPEHFENEAEHFTRDHQKDLPVPVIPVGERGGVFAAYGHVDKAQMLQAARVVDQHEGLSLDEVDDNVTTDDVQHRHALTLGDPGYGWWDLDIGDGVTIDTHGAIPVTVLDIRGRNNPPTHQ